MKKILFASVLVALLTAVGLTQNTSTAPLGYIVKEGDPNFHGTPGWGNPPASAATLIFYGGDFNADDNNAVALANGNSLLIPDTATYGAVTAPKGSKVVATGVLFNGFAICYSDFPGTTEACPGSKNYDPATGTYDIRTDVSEGSGGKDLVHGSGPQTQAATGRSIALGCCTYLEYSTSVMFTKPLTPAGGTTYWLNESPQCTDSSNVNCGVETFNVSNTTEQTNGINAKLQPTGEIFINSSFFGENWENPCEFLNPQQCARLSFGVYGH
jgi:hypothetical protein